MNTALLTASIATLTAGLFLQDPQRPPTPTSQPPATQDGRSSATATNDAILVTWLLVDNENEVALSRIALQKAQNAEVKQFAQQMVDDHGRMVQKLNAMAGTGARTPVGADTTRSDPTRPADSGRRDASLDSKPMDASGVRVVGAIDHERLIRDLGRQCLESHSRILQEKQGAEFDRCYMGMQVGAHVKAVDTVEVFRNYASPALRPSLDEALPTLQQHLQHAKTLAKQVDDAKTTMGSDKIDTPRK